MENWKQKALVEIIKIITMSNETAEKKDAALAGLMQLAENAPSAPPVVDTQETSNDDLTAEKESQMILNTPRVSVTTKPRKDGRYQGYVVLGGEKHFFYGRAYDEVVIKIKYYVKQWQRLQLELPATVVAQPKKVQTPRFADFVHNWIETYKRPNLKPTSLVSLQRSLKHAVLAFGDREIGDITSDDVQKLLISIEAERIRDLCNQPVAMLEESGFAGHTGTQSLRRGGIEVAQASTQERAHRRRARAILAGDCGQQVFATLPCAIGDGDADWGSARPASV